MLCKYCTQYVNKFGKLSSGHRTGKYNFSFQSLRKAMSKNAQTTAQLHSSHTCKVMFKVFQARLQQYMNHEFPDVQAGFRKDRNQRSNYQHLLDHWKSRKVPKKNKNKISFCFINYDKDFGCVNHNKLWKILQEIGIPDNLTCFLRNRYAGQEVTFRTGHGTTNWFQIEKGVCQGCILSPCLFNFYAEYIMRNAGLEEVQAGIKTARRNINHLRYSDDTTLRQKVKRN